MDIEENKARESNDYKSLIKAENYQNIEIFRTLL